MANLGREDHQEEATPLLKQPLPERQGRRRKGDEIRDKYRLPERNDGYSKMKAQHKGTSAVPVSLSQLPDVCLSSHNRGDGALQVSACMSVRMYMST